LMSDTRAAMREFRFLDDKRKQGGLSAAEEQRWTELRHSLGLPEAAPDPDAPVAPEYANPDATAQGYYGQDGHWYQHAESPEGQPADAADPAAQAQGYYATDGNWYPYQTAQDGQGYDASAYAAQPGEDPNQPQPQPQAE